MILGLIIVVACIVVGLIMMAFCYPELLTRFGKLIFRAVKRALGKPTFAPEQEEAKAKTKKLSPLMALANKIEQIGPGQTLRFRISETSGGDFIAVELDPQEPQTSKKYILSMEKAVNGMPGQERTIMYISDKPMQIAASIIDRNGELFTAAGEKSVSSEKVAVGVKNK